MWKYIEWKQRQHDIRRKHPNNIQEKSGSLTTLQRFAPKNQRWRKSEDVRIDPKRYGKINKDEYELIRTNTKSWARRKKQKRRHVEFITRMNRLGRPRAHQHVASHHYLPYFRRSTTWRFELMVVIIVNIINKLLPW